MGKMKQKELKIEDIQKEEKKVKKTAETKEAAKKSEGTENAAVKKESSKTEKKKGQPGRGKKYKAIKKTADKTKKYTAEAAVALLKKMKYVKFDESVDLHLNLLKEGVKGEVELPHSTGKTVRIAVLDDKVLAALENGKIEFDILITHPSFMPKIAKFAKILGPKGLMPNPKAGTISTTPEEVAKKFMKGMLRFKSESKFPLMHQMVGRLSYEDNKLVENIKAFVAAVGKVNIKEVYVASSMSPSVRLDLESI
ncbi:hypothetical protein COY90_00590 [Candidatus Roizmanbacteria bacterium CG_4_10_14_0_8_um_filter_39_9]|uniref:Large ribosomal subunit protein uL1 n=1 Tax=Candidatus Roizmanbacteria bacterium CG_4_10_14_0_8_um_filter_39_9 TaxID=1974829 RepID=A0A2M7QE05_9BACT|nr:MAG: hypothetical protein COY90_00590 [Candidatus Roizmanbacteria bacterium CG_4_10_14_0_8_um_filter_39_9]